MTAPKVSSSLLSKDQEQSRDKHSLNIVEEEERVAKELSKVSPSVLGARIKRARLRQGFSVREMAERACVSKNSILRLEQGGGTHPLTVMKVCAAMGFHLISFTQPETQEHESAIVHRKEDDRWYDIADVALGPFGDDRPLTDKERKKLADEGQKVQLLILKSRLPDGELLSTIIELYGESERRSHPGEEIVYCIKGTAIITVGDKEYLVKEGETIIFWSSEEHYYAPAPECIEKGELPVRLFSVRMDEPKR